MTIILIILGWILCGLLSIYVGGLCDRLDYSSVSVGEEYPFSISILGPLALVITLSILFSMVCVRFILTFSDKPKFLKRIYNLGRGRK